MSSPPRALRINASELRRQPGSRRRVELVDPARRPRPRRRPCRRRRRRRGRSRVDDRRHRRRRHGFGRRGRTPAGAASRPIDGVAVAHVDELYQDHVTDPDAFPIEGDQLDLAPMARELVLLELPDAPLCRDDCAGICAVCGRDRNVEPCDCDDTVRDERWAVLDQLDLD